MLQLTLYVPNSPFNLFFVARLTQSHDIILTFIKNNVTLQNIRLVGPSTLDVSYMILTIFITINICINCFSNDDLCSVRKFQVSKIAKHDFKFKTCLV